MFHTCLMRTWGQSPSQALRSPPVLLGKVPAPGSSLGSLWLVERDGAPRAPCPKSAGMAGDCERAAVTLPQPRRLSGAPGAFWKECRHEGLSSKCHQPVRVAARNVLNPSVTQTALKSIGVSWTSVLPARQLTGAQAAFCSVAVSPASGTLGPNEEQEFCVELSANVRVSLSIS